MVRAATALLLVIGLLFFGLISMPVDATGTESPVKNAFQDGNFTSVSSGPAAPSRRTNNGTIQAVVRFEEINDVVVSSSRDPVKTLRSHAEQSRSSFKNYAIKSKNIRIIEEFWITNAVLVEVNTNRIPLADIAARDGIKRIHRNYRFQHSSSTTADSSLLQSTAATPNTSSITASSKYTYGIERINAPDVWKEYDTDGDNVTVAVLDSGVDASNHSDLAISNDDWVDFINDRPTPYDDNGHGTHVSGTIVGHQTPNGVQYGVAPDATLLHAKVTNETGIGSFRTINNGIEWAIQHDADILSMSLGSPGYRHSLVESVRNAHDAGIVVVAAAGNTGSGTSASPGNIYESIAVGASAPDNSVSGFSSGETIETADDWERNGWEAPASWPAEYVVPDVAAPGIDIRSSYPGGGYRRLDGTSMATPHATGTAVLMQSATRETLSPTEINTALTTTAWKPAGAPTKKDTRYGSGIIDAYAAVTEVRDEKATASLSIIDTHMQPKEIVENDSTVITATIENSGTATGSFTAGLRINGVTESIDSITVAPTETDVVAFNPSFERAGDYSISVNETTVGTLHVERPATFVIESPSIDSETIETNESVNVSATVSNTGDRNGTFTGVLRVDDQITQTQSRPIPAGDSRQLVFTENFNQTGNYTVKINNTVAGTVQVTEPEPTEPSIKRFDAKGTGLITFPDVIRAIAAHNEGRPIGGKPVSFDNVIELISAHNEGRQIH